MHGTTPQIGVLGVGGYAGAELARLLLRHPRLTQTRPLFFGRENAASAPLWSLHPRLMGTPGSEAAIVEPFSWQAVTAQNVSVLLLATPHEQSRSLVPAALEHGVRIVDLSGAWRLRQYANRRIYAFEDEDAPHTASTQASSVYGLPEFHGHHISSAQVVANPGCYATSILIALKPLVHAGWIALDRGIICDSKSGVSGAGKAATAKTHFMHVADNLSAYGLFSHRHTGELLEQLGVSDDEITFTPHLLPIPRGILSTIYVSFTSPKTSEQVETCLRQFYAERRLVRIYGAGHLPQIQHSVSTAFADVGFQLSHDGRRCILVSCLDNLLKGAASQAVQNMNLMCGWDEAEGLL